MEDSVDAPTLSAEGFDIDRVPVSFKEFLKDNDIDHRIYSITQLPRYVRWNTRYPLDEVSVLDQLKKQLDTDNVHQVKGMKGFFAIDLGGKRLVDIPLYKEHKLFGIDLSSAIAVDALDIEKDDQVLDLCCAPGAKLCMIANLLHGNGTATGVDLASHRLATCRSLLKKYRVGGYVRLFEADGTQFAVPAPSRLGNVLLHDDQPPPSKRQKSQESVLQKPFWAPKILRFDPQLPNILYDKVLVDAECTHDGSIIHILKYDKWGWDTFEKNFMDPNRIRTICELQRNLMKQGWSMLKENGIMVYSTCSLTIKQNEENVAWFLSQHKNAVLETIPCVESLDIRLAAIKHVTQEADIQDRINKHCVRFDPFISKTSGFFVARFRKSHHIVTTSTAYTEHE
ncbi:S-adenosyl-L-methionine-dependent methyltransferase [Radiomyces spectabilis]|uniref:S-adenosyl-L-methionine-dependent methyltransferase n=1 Tax=Radiomyces spectabilis TaxID=64574 RepID=UPI00221E754F|nr:S-adenosyl-L-methionine-dependent methyltransferase [Radiomyces spectabilis]KAI8384614.1 S-adenosyl-L-methionine-dependent methyltransferase [Radiomyces spectabilis]